MRIEFYSGIFANNGASIVHRALCRPCWETAQLSLPVVRTALEPKDQHKSHIRAQLTERLAERGCTHAKQETVPCLTFR